MTIYKTTKRDTKIARKIYEKHHGPIPFDDNGRRLEIHHIDGDHNNNTITNLVAVTIEEHYDLHYEQEDWGACYAIGVRMKMSPEQLSKLSSDTQNKRITDGTHHFITNNPVHRRIEDGSHLFYDESFRANTNKILREMFIDGSHPFCDGSSATLRNKKRVENGTHHFLGGDVQRQLSLSRVADGSHPFLNKEMARTRAFKRLTDGTHNFTGNNAPSQFQWTCEYCGKTGKGKGNFTKHHGDNCKHKR